MRLHVHEWGNPAGPPLLCLHGVTSHGGRFRRLAEEHLADRHVVALDLRGHGRSDWDPPWDLDTHVVDVLDTIDVLGVGRTDVVGHSFGGRVALELAAKHPERVGHLALLDPAVWVPPPVAHERAERHRPDESFAQVEEAIQARLAIGTALTRRDFLAEDLPEHLEPGPDGRLRYRYSRSAVIAAYGEMAKTPPLADVHARVLLIHAEESDVLPEVLREAVLGELRDAEAVSVPGGHVVFWDAFDATGEALCAFLDPVPLPDGVNRSTGTEHGRSPCS
jgi:lipase